MDERRHNMDGALFVDEERAERGERSPRPRTASFDDGKADAARRITQGILDRMDLDASVHVREDDEQVVLDIDGPDAGRAIGKKGMTLEALQFLVNKIVNRDPDERRHVVLDSGDYRERHDNGLVSMAKREAKRAVTSGRPVTLEPMSARDRRVIHVSLAKFPGVSTRSEGEGMERRLQIIPARGERAREGGRDDRRDDRPRERAGERPAARDDRPRPARDDRPRSNVRSDRPIANERSERDRPLERDRGADRPERAERLPERERGADRPERAERLPERDRGADRPERAERLPERDRPAPRSPERPAERPPVSERERITERDRPEPRRERDLNRSYGGERSDRDAARLPEPAAERAPRDYDDRLDRGRGR